MKTQIREIESKPLEDGTKTTRKVLVNLPGQRSYNNLRDTIKAVEKDLSELHNSALGKISKGGV